jgi:hypothetical protein
LHEGPHPPGKGWAQFPAQANVKHQPGVACDEPPKFGRRHVILSQEDFNIAPDIHLLFSFFRSGLNRPIFESFLPFEILLV